MESPRLTAQLTREMIEGLLSRISTDDQRKAFA
jgi:hypothetical protein